MLRWESEIRVLLTFFGFATVWISSASERMLCMLIQIYQLLHKTDLVLGKNGSFVSFALKEKIKKRSQWFL